MKNKVVQTYISLFVSAITLVAIIICFFCNDFSIKSLILNILYSLFGGAILSFVLSLFEYINVKRETLNDFYDEYIEFLKIIHNVSFLDVTEFEEVVAKFIALEALFKDDDFERKAFCETAKAELEKVGIRISVEGVIPFLQLEADSFKKKLIETIMSYLDVSKYRLNRLWRITTSIYFASPFLNKTHKEYLKLFEEADSLIKAISFKSLHFDMFIKKEIGNVYQMTKYVNALNERLYRIEKNDGATMAWEETFNNLLNRLNKLIDSKANKNYQTVDEKPFYYSKTTFN